MDAEKDGKISFLDLSVSRKNNTNTTTVFRKDTFSGQDISYFSYCCSLFKINSIKTLMFRSYHISSDYLNLHNEFSFLVDFFSNNGFPKFLVTSNVRKFLDCIFQNNVPDPTKNENSRYIALLFFGPQTEKLKKDSYSFIA